jgi:hypothetical protein
MAGSVNRTRRRYQLAAAAPVVAVFAALYGWLVSIMGHAESPDLYLWVALPVVILASLWLSTSWLLVHHWWKRDGARLSTMDGPQRLLSSAVATLPEPRRRWGEAMLAELDQVRGRPARWRFALSCARAALSLPMPTRRPVLAVAAGVVVVAVWAATCFVVVVTAPRLFFFAVGFVALMGVIVLLVIARRRRVRWPAPKATVLVTGAVAAAVVALVALELRLPDGLTVLPPGRAGFLAAVLAGCLWLAVAPPRWMAGGRLAPYAGTGAGIAFALVLLALGVVRVDGLSALWLVLAPELTFMAPALLAAAATRSFRAGVQAGVWTAITVAPLAYAGGLAGTLVAYVTSGRFTFAGDVLPAGFDFAFALLVLAVIPAVGFPFAVIGATVGTRLRGRGAQAGHAVPVAES